MYGNNNMALRNFDKLLFFILNSVILCAPLRGEKQEKTIRQEMIMDNKKLFCSLKERIHRGG